MKVERLSDTEVREFLCEARALRSAYLAQLLSDGANKLRAAVLGFWHGAHQSQPAALFRPAPRQPGIDIEPPFVVR